MIIDFTVENFRSIKGPATLSFVAQKGRRSAGRTGGAILTDDEIAPPRNLPGRGLGLMPVLALYGPNASGKSNMVRALDEFLLLMASGADSRRRLAGRFLPFLLDENGSEMPRTFEIRVAVAERIYSYALSIGDEGVILLERLDYSPRPEKRQSERLLYSRTWDAKAQEYHILTGDDFAGAHVQLLDTLQNHEPFLTLLVRRLRIEVVKPLAWWLRMRMPGIWQGDEALHESVVATAGRDRSGTYRKALELIRRFDVGLTDIEIEGIETRSGEAEEYEFYAIHKHGAEEIRWPLELESLGTRRLFPLAYFIISALEDGSCLVIDEFGANFHPHIAHHIIKLFQNPQTNPSGAQLIFTSHDTRLWRDQLLRRDQIWFTEKESDGGTRLFPLTDFKVRNDLALEKAYLDGRFGAVPNLPEPEELLREVEGREVEGREVQA